MIQTGRPIIHVAGSGNIGNQMIRAMSAMSIAERVEGARLSGISLPEWNILHPVIPRSSGVLETFSSARHMDINADHLVQMMRMGRIHRIELSSYAQHLSNFLPVEYYRNIFIDPRLDIPKFGENDLVINIRGGETLRAIHADYTLVPVEFYQEVVSQTKLRPVFMGQIDSNPYTDRLRQVFPNAEYLPSQGVMEDFSIIRNAKNIIISVSTFSWLAAWLSNADRIILPVSGFLSPTQFSEIDLLPTNDPRYEYYLFPINYAVPVDQHEAAHRAMNGLWRKIAPEDISSIRRKMPEVVVDRGKYISRFDEEFYLSTYPDVKRAVETGRSFKSGLDHYSVTGFYAGRLPFSFNRVEYVIKYPQAAVAIANGAYMNPLHHYIETTHQEARFFDQELASLLPVPSL
jgi:hypothetical protein